jgi:chemotaxis response regulator CheB
MARREIIGIGGSAGSIDPIRQICRDLPSDLQATILIAVHVSVGQNLLAGILTAMDRSRSAPLWTASPWSVVESMSLPPTIIC